MRLTNLLAAAATSRLAGRLRHRGRLPARVTALHPLSPCRLLSTKARGETQAEVLSSLPQAFQDAFATRDFEALAALLRRMDPSEANTLMERVEAVASPPRDEEDDDHGADSADELEAASGGSLLQEELEASEMEASHERELEMGHSSLAKLLEGSEDERARARSIYDGMLRRREAYAVYTSMMMRACSSVGEQRTLLEEAEAAGVVPSASCYTAILSQLQFEARPEAMLGVLREMAERRIERDQYVAATFERSDEVLSRMRTAKLRQMLGGGERERTRALWLFDSLVQRGAAASHHLGVMLRGCATSAEQRELMGRAEAAGVPPDAQCYNLLLGRLQLEGEAAKVDEALAELQSRGIEVDDYLRATLSRSEQTWSKMRTAELKRLLGSPAAQARARGGEREAARRLFGGLLVHGLANSYLLGAMLPARNGDRSGALALYEAALEALPPEETAPHLQTALRLCGTSGKLRALLGRARAAGVRPGLPAFTVMATQLQLEAGARASSNQLRALEAEMVAGGIQPDAQFLDTLRRTPAEIRLMQHTELASLLFSHDREAQADGRRLFSAMLRARSADAYHLKIMLSACVDAAEQHSVLHEADEVAGLHPDGAGYEQRILKLQLEGRLDEVDGVVAEIERRGITSLEAAAHDGVAPWRTGTAKPWSPPPGGGAAAEGEGEGAAAGAGGGNTTLDGLLARRPRRRLLALGDAVGDVRLRRRAAGADGTRARARPQTRRVELQRRAGADADGGRGRRARAQAAEDDGGRGHRANAARPLGARALGGRYLADAHSADAPARRGWRRLRHRHGTQALRRPAHAGPRHVAPRVRAAARHHRHERAAAAPRARRGGHAPPARAQRLAPHDPRQQGARRRRRPASRWRRWQYEQRRRQ